MFLSYWWSYVILLYCLFSMQKKNFFSPYFSYLFLLFINLQNRIRQIYYLTFLYDILSCFGSGSGRIRVIWPDLDPDPLQESLIRILVSKKNCDKLPLKSTKIIRIYFLIYVNNTLIIYKKKHREYYTFYRKKFRKKNWNMFIHILGRVLIPEFETLLCFIRSGF